MTKWTPLKTIIRQRRIQLGLSQTDLANRMGTVSSEFICMAEHGRRYFDPDNIPRLAAALQLRAADLCIYFLYEKSRALYVATFGGVQPPEPEPITNQ